MNTLTSWATPQSSIKNDLFEKDPIETIDIYLDCQTQSCYTNYIRNKVAFLNYVRDQKDADIHLQIKSINTGSGKQYTLTYYGQKAFAGRENKIRFFSSDNQTTDERRQKLIQFLKLGMASYLVETKLVDRITINVEQTEIDPNTDIENENHSTDGWNYWVFEVGSSTFFNGSDTQESFRLNGEISATRITRDWKIRMKSRGKYEYNWFELSDGRTTSTKVQDRSINGLFAKAVSPHWSVGMFTEAGSSTYDNYKTQVKFSPAFEYNFFDYEEYGERELRLMYRLSSGYAQYIEETIYEKTSEMLYNHRLSINLDINRHGAVYAVQHLHHIICMILI